jgi:holliday junction DNA helicase RuvA
MFEYLKGSLTQLTPAYAVIDVHGVGYLVNISLQTYSALVTQTEVKLLVHPVVREDAHLLYGFFTGGERDLFRLLISVSGVGANTARMMLSSLQTTELVQAIASGNADVLKNVKGIGLKTAQRIIVDLKDKVSLGSNDQEIFTRSNNTQMEEALSALIALGFAKVPSEKVLAKINSRETDLKVEDLIKQALKQL